MNHVQGNGMQQVRALAWEFWAHGWRGQLLGLAGAIGFASLLYSVISGISDISFRGTEAGRAMHFGFYCVTLVFLGAPILAAWGVPGRRYTLPTSSFVIVACPMVCSMVSMFMLYAMAAATLNILYDAGWPIWGPGLVAAISIAWLHAFFWSMANSRGFQLASLASCLMILASWGVLLFGAIELASLGGPTEVWFHEGVNTSHVLMFSLASIVCVGVGTVGFASLRCGSGFEVRRIIDWAIQRFPKAASATPFSSPGVAQFWLEWTERGYVMPIGTALIGVAVLLITPFVPPPGSIEFINVISAMLFLPTIVVGLFLGARSPHGQFGNFNGSRPLTDSQIAIAVLTSVTAGVLSSALIWATVMGVVSLILGQAKDLVSLPSTIEQAGLVRLLGIATLVIGTVWGVVGLMTSLVLAGKKVFGVVLGTVIGVFIAGGIGPQLLLSSEAQDTFGYVFRWLCVVLSPVGVVTAFVASWWMKLISRGTLLLATAILGAMLAAAYGSGFTSEPDAFLAVLSGCCLVPSALAVAPLAVWWNRHR